ncbi:MAG: hypothetical protein IPJ49_19310 [Candidatus Obscuribacter sp.]|nr:hypothetical protein [Candidatus Obscuribacter sp.]
MKSVSVRLTLGVVTAARGGTASAVEASVATHLGDQVDDGTVGPAGEAGEGDVVSVIGRDRAVTLGAENRCTVETTDGQVVEVDLVTGVERLFDGLAPGETDDALDRRGQETSQRSQVEVDVGSAVQAGFDGIAPGQPVSLTDVRQNWLMMPAKLLGRPAEARMMLVLVFMVVISVGLAVIENELCCCCQHGS